MNHEGEHAERTTIDFIIFSCTSLVFFMALGGLIIGSALLATIGTILTAVGLWCANLREGE